MDRFAVSGVDDIMSYLGDLDDHSDTEVVFKSPFRPQSSNTPHLAKREKAAPADVKVVKQKPGPEILPTRTSRGISIVLDGPIEPPKRKKNTLVQSPKSGDEEIRVEEGFNGATPRRTVPATVEMASVGQKSVQTPSSSSGDSKPLEKRARKQGKKRTAKEETYSVETIMGKKKVNGVIFYNVKWTGFDATHNSWEPLQNFDDLDLIEVYEEKLSQMKSNGQPSKSENLVRPRPGNVTQRKIVCNTHESPQSSFIQAEIEDDTMNEFAKEFIIPLSGQAALASFKRLQKLWMVSMEEQKQDASERLDEKSVTKRASHSQTYRKMFEIQ